MRESTPGRRTEPRRKRVLIILHGVAPGEIRGEIVVHDVQHLDPAVVGHDPGRQVQSVGGQRPGESAQNSLRGEAEGPARFSILRRRQGKRFQNFPAFQGKILRLALPVSVPEPSGLEVQR